MIKSTHIELYDWFDIQAELCNVMGITDDKFRRYHEVVGGDYKDFWHVCLDTIVPDNMSNDSVVTLYEVDCEWYTGTEEWKNRVLHAWNIVYKSIVGTDNDPGIYVKFSW